MAAAQLEYSLTQPHLEVRKANLLTSYVKSLFSEERTLDRPDLKKLNTYFDHKVELTMLPHIFGHNIASNSAAISLRAGFPWQELRALSQEEIITAATALGYTVFTALESPYHNFPISTNQFGVLHFDEPLKTDFTAATTLWKKVALRLRPNPKPTLLSSFSSLKFQTKEAYIPELRLELQPGTEVPITFTGLDTAYSSGSTKSEMVQNILQYLQLKLPPIHLPERLLYVPLNELVSSPYYYQTLKNNSYWHQAEGMYFLESELPSSLIPPQ